VDTSNILFILSGAFVGLERTIQDRLAKGVNIIKIQEGRVSLIILFFF
jgi:ATP-dependent Clp protease ATP-binding subunit ClpX